MRGQQRPEDAAALRPKRRHPRPGGALRQHGAEAVAGQHPAADTGRCPLLDTWREAGHSSCSPTSTEWAHRTQGPRGRAGRGAGTVQGGIQGRPSHSVTHARRGEASRCRGKSMHDTVVWPL